MALTFTNATSNRVDCGTGPALGATALSGIVWCNPTAITAGRRVLTKHGTGVGAVAWFFNFRNPSTLAFAWIGSTNLDYVAANNTLNGLTNTELVLAFSVDLAAGAGSLVHIYVGSTTTPLAEVSYQSTTDGSVHNGANGNFVIGNDGSSNVAFSGAISRVVLFGSALSLAQFQRYQFSPAGAIGNHWELGWNGTSTQTDYGGQAAHGTVSGATVVAHVPSRPIFGGVAGWQGITATAAAGLSIPIAAMHYRKLMGAM